MATIRTATVATGITASLQRLSTLLTGAGAIAARTKNYDDAVIFNGGTVALYYAVVDNDTYVPTTADQRTLLPGAEKELDQINTDFIYIATSDIGGTNVFEFDGKPTYRP